MPPGRADCTWSRPSEWTGTAKSLEASRSSAERRIQDESPWTPGADVQSKCCDAQQRQLYLGKEADGTLQILRRVGVFGGETRILVGLWVRRHVVPSGL